MSAIFANPDELKPSLFELLSEQQLSGLIPPSLRHLLLVATQRHPRYLLRAFNSFDEIYALGSLALERYFLRTYGGSFTENFYGLKRERAPQIKGGEAPRLRSGAPELLRESLRLTNSDVWKNLAVLVALPYVKRKLDQSFEIYGATQSAVIQVGPSYRRDELPPNPTLRQRLFWCFKWFLRKVYPSINAAYHLSLIAFSLAYLFDNTKYSSPFLWLIGTRIRRLNEADYRAIAKVASSSVSTRPGSKRIGKAGSSRGTMLSPSVIGPALSKQFLSGLKLVLPASIFALKVLEWWHASDFASQLSKKTVEGLDLSPPTIAVQFGQKKGARNAVPDGSGLPSSKLGPARNSVALSDSPSPTPLSGTELSGASTEPTSVDTMRAGTTHSKISAPVSSLSNLPIYTVAVTDATTSSLCPICRHPIQTPTSAQTGYVYCFTCIFRWVDGSHERQAAFMEGRQIEGAWGEDEGIAGKTDGASKEGEKTSREKEWESGKGRCAVTGLRVLGGTDGLRRVMV